MRWFFLISNVVAAFALLCAGSMAVAAHRTHAYSVYKELQIQHVLVERPDYDVEQRLRHIADGGMYSMWIAELGAAILLVNAGATFILLRRPNPD